MGLRDLRAQFERHLSAILTAARAAKRAPADWQAVRQQWTPGAPVTGNYVGDAAHPAEVREVLIALATAAEQQVALVGGNADDDETWEFLHRRLPDFVRDESNAYIESVRPSLSLGSVFQQAAQRQGKSSGLPGQAMEPKAMAMKCKRCGAPRERESEYSNCAYCGEAFFP
jgi:hypothetical protein